MDVAMQLDFAIRPQDETRLYSRLCMGRVGNRDMADGVWQRSAAGRQISLGDPKVLVEGRRLFSDFSAQNVSGSRYSIAEYCVDSELGGADGLAEARRQLAARGLRMMLDFVPNHVAPGHPWIRQHPEYFVQGELGEHLRNPKGSPLERT